MWGNCSTCLLLKLVVEAFGFELPDQDGVVRKLADYIGKVVLIYFYPKDDTPGCTIEACNFRDNYHQLEKMGVQIIGISKDSVKSHKKFADKYNLNFPLLSDEQKQTIKNYAALGKKKFLGREYEGVLRKSFLIDKNGEIKKIYENVNPLKHASEVVGDVAPLI